jgi:hypothetical protein
MMTFRQFCESGINEGVVGKAAVAGYAVQGGRHGDAAVRSFQLAMTRYQRIATDKESSGTDKQQATADANLADGLIALRRQIGAISAQITAAAMFNAESK